MSHTKRRVSKARRYSSVWVGDSPGLLGRKPAYTRTYSGYVNVPIQEHVIELGPHEQVPPSSDEVLTEVLRGEISWGLPLSVGVCTDFVGPVTADTHIDQGVAALAAKYREAQNENKRLREEIRNLKLQLSSLNEGMEESTRSRIFSPSYDHEAIFTDTMDVNVDDLPELEPTIRPIRHSVR